MSSPDQASLEAERDFLLESLRRLDQEQAAGALTQQEYIDLRDEQTVKAAQVLKQLDAVAAPKVEVEPKPARQRPAFLSKAGKDKKTWYAVTGVFAVIAVLGVIGAATGRLSGDNTTGSINADSNTLLQRAADQSSKGNVADAVKTYDQVLKQDPQNVQALAYKGWLIRLAGLSQPGLDSINQALTLNPKYPDAHFFKGFILFRDQNNTAGAIAEFNEFMADNPPEAMVPLVQQTLQDAQAELAAAHK